VSCPVPDAARTVVPPRFGTPRRELRPTRGALLIEIMRLLGFEPFDWQRHVADVALELDPVTRVPAYRTVGVSVARQNGKTTLVAARVAMQLIVPRATVVYTAQDRNLARFKWQEHCDLLMSTPFAARVRSYDRVNGREQLVMQNGARYMIVTPGERAGRGLTVDLAVIDEAFAQQSMQLAGAVSGAMSARRAAQLWLLSNAGTHKSVLWRHYTEIGRASIGDVRSSLCWLEWAADDAADAHDRRQWAQANPTLDLPHGVSSVALADAAANLDLSTFAREHLNVWAELSTVYGIDPITWAACRDDTARPGTDLAVSIDITPERDSGSIVVAGDVDGRVALEVIETSADVVRLVQTALDVAQRWSAPVIIDRGSPAANAVPLFERAGVTVRQLALPDYVRACGDFHDAVVHGTVTHRGDYRLTDAVAAATKRRVGDAWVWQRRAGADITPLTAATLARWGIIGGLASMPRVW
jgi:Phage Terminase